jgi:hypothetical protein
MKHLTTFTLYEAHYTDLYPKGFQAFMKKYSKAPKQDNLYIQFSNHKDNTMDRNAHLTPNHKDPVANYAYPMGYVVKHPADIWYGRDAKYLRVLEIVSDRVLYLQHIVSEQDVLNMLSTVWRHDRVVEMVRMARKNRRLRDRIGTGKSRYARLFFTLVQVDVEASDAEKIVVRSGVEQTGILTSLGYDVMVDKAKSSGSAVINSREPEQALFLNRKSFRVIDVFHNNHKNNASELGGYSSPDDNERKWASAILDALDGDRIREAKDGMRRNTVGRYFSVAGRSMGIHFERDMAFYDGKGFGEKTHREDRLHDAHICVINIETEYGTLDYESKRDEKMDAVVKHVRELWDAMKSDGHRLPDWEPQTVASVAAERERKEKARLAEKIRRELEADIQRLPRFKAKVAEYEKVLGVGLSYHADDALNVKLMNRVSDILDKAHNTSLTVDELIERLERHKESNKGYKPFYLKMMYGGDIAIADQFVRFMRRYFEKYTDRHEHDMYEFYNRDVI